MIKSTNANSDIPGNMDDRSSRPEVFLKISQN